MAESGKQKTIMFLTGPVKEVEEQLTELPGEWAAIEFYYHVIDNRCCVTVRLMPAVLLRQMQLMQGVQPNHRLG